MTSDPADPEAPDPGGAVPPVTVRDVVSWPGFDVRVLTGETGLDRPVRLAHPTELVDPSAFLRGGELILTVGSDLRTAADRRAFVDALARAGAAGIGLAVGVSGHEPPLELADEARRAGLALFTVPNTLPFVAFTERLQEVHDAARRARRERREDGRVLDYVRRGLASAGVLRDRLPAHVLDGDLAVLCLPAGRACPVTGPHVEGWIGEVAVVVAAAGAVASGAAALATPSPSSPPVPHATGGPGPLPRVARSVREGLAAFAIAARRGSPAGPRDLATFSGLLERMTSEDLAPFADHVLEPLVRYDARHGSQLVATVQTYLHLDGSLTATAQALFVHPNSVRNRLARVRDLTGTDPASFDGRVALVLALRSRGRGDG
ncbi:PucR family transcriptional regulator [Kineococcus sp. SYSU DK004]|uniref:PucR family transcriptional regulator n=1 Tax=Kineococcus sp. SYSU DK004 TaxID=3383125 RepID=UPI003D7ED995